MNDLPGLPDYLAVVNLDTFGRREITIDETPPSMNDNTIRSHWRGFHTAKKDWEERIQSELMVARYPFANQRVIVGARMRFPRKSRRDSGNFASVLDKALGDALTFSGDRLRPDRLRYIADDTPEFYFFAGVEFEEERGPARTTLVLFNQTREDGLWPTNE